MVFLIQTIEGVWAMAKSGGKDKDLARRLENFRELARYVREVALRDSPRDSDAAVVDRITSLIGKSRINTSMFGRYIKGEQSAEVQPKTYLSFAEFLMKAEPRKWGPTLDDALTQVYDWVVYGPEGAPPDAPEYRHRGRPGVAQIQAGNSPQTQRLAQDAPDMSVAEILDGIETLVSALRWRIQDLGEDTDSLPTALAPPLPCNDDNPLSSLLYASLQRPRPTNEADRKEAVAELSKRSGLSHGRCRAILCGDHPSQSEVDALAGVVNMPPEHLSLVIGRFHAASLPVQNGKAVA